MEMQLTIERKSMHGQWLYFYVEEIASESGMQSERVKLHSFWENQIWILIILIKFIFTSPTSRSETRFEMSILKSGLSKLLFTFQLNFVMSTIICI